MRSKKKSPKTKLNRRKATVQKTNTHRSEHSLSHRRCKTAMRLGRSKPSPDLLERIDFLACLFAK
jgi:hypothetical protein